MVGGLLPLTWDIPGTIHSRRVQVLPLSSDRWTNSFSPPTEIMPSSMGCSRMWSPSCSASPRRSSAQNSCPTAPAQMYVPSGCTSSNRSSCSLGVVPGQLYGIVGSSVSLHVTPSSSETKARQLPTGWWLGHVWTRAAATSRPSGRMSILGIPE